VGTRRHLGAGIQQVPQGGYRRPDAQVVGNDPASEGHVEIAAHEHPTTVQVAKILQPGNVHGIGGPDGYFRFPALAFFVRRVPTIRARSTRRVE